MLSDCFFFMWLLYSILQHNTLQFPLCVVHNLKALGQTRRFSIKQRASTSFFETVTRALCEAVSHVKVATQSERSSVDRLRQIVSVVSGVCVDAGIPARPLRPVAWESAV